MAQIIKLSLIISSYNRKDDLIETISYSKKFLRNDIEILVVDSQSTDGTKQYLLNLNDKDIKVHILDEDRGSAYMHTYGMTRAKGEYIICIDDDCYLAANVIPETIRILDKYKNLGSIGFGLINPNTDFNKNLIYKTNQIDDEKYNISNSYEIKNYASAQAYRKSVLKEVDYMDLNWTWGTNTEDLDLNYSIISHGYNAVKIDELLSFHKVSIKNRNADKFSKNRVNGMFWIILKHYPRDQMLIYYFRFFSLCVYYSIINLNFNYIKGFLNSIKLSPHYIKNTPRIKKEIFNKVIIPLGWFFSIPKKTKWFGEE